MPQASDELRQKMKELFGHPIDDSGPMEYLQNRGFVLRPDYYWEHPRMTYDTMQEKDYLCILFLCHEWDFGGLKTKQPLQPY